MDTQLIKECEAKALTWLNSPYYDNETKAEIKAMLDNDDKNPLIDAFYQSLEAVCAALWVPVPIV